MMHAGNLGLAQDLGTVISAAERLATRPDIRFVFVGDGASRATLQRHVAERSLTNVTFLPYLPKEQVQEVIAAADVHLITLAPGLKGCAVPSKVYGIMAAGRPFIAAVDDDSEIDLIVRDHECGVRVPPRDPGALAATVASMPGRPLDEMGQRGKTAFEASYTRSIATERYRLLLERVVQQ